MPGTKKVGTVVHLAENTPLTGRGKCRSMNDKRRPRGRRLD